MMAGFKGADPTGESERATELEGEAEAMLLFKSWPQKSCSVTSTAFCWSGHKLPPRFKSPSLSGRGAKVTPRKEHVE